MQTFKSFLTEANLENVTLEPPSPDPAWDELHPDSAAADFEIIHPQYGCIGTVSVQSNELNGTFPPIKQARSVKMGIQMHHNPKVPSAFLASYSDAAGVTYKLGASSIRQMLKQLKRYLPSLQHISNSPRTTGVRRFTHKSAHLSLGEQVGGSRQPLTEALETWYHGSAAKIDKLTLDHLGSGAGHDQEGPGIYLTNNHEDACRYGRYVYTVQAKMVKSRMMPDKRKIDLQRIRTLIWKSPDRDDNLSNWDENPQRALSLAADQIMSSYGPDEYREAMEQVWYDFYKDHQAVFLSKMRVLGWDGFILDRNGGVKHFVCFNPEILKITDVEDRGHQG